jgi:pteridine reductase
MDTTVRVALVTGAARRVGRAIVQRLAAAVFDIAFTYSQSETEALELLRTLRESGRRAEAIRADLRRPEEAIHALSAAFDRHFNRLDVLVNNASIYEPSSLATVTTEQMRNLWSIHVEAPLLLCRRFEMALRDSRGHVINMVDLLAEKPRPDYLAYCASKAALASLTLGLARELAPQVTVNGIAPGVVDWPDDYPEDERRQYLARVPLARAGTPQDVAELVHFLCTTGNYITGQILRLDGGRSIT